MRDTDADWDRIARDQPYFGVLAQPEFLVEAIDDAAKERFFASGRGDIDHAISVIRAHLDADFAPATATDFGCGVGRLSLAMADHAGHVVGVDVAVAMRDLATDHARSRHIANVEFRDAVPPETNWVNSLIVFQHIPPPRGHELLDELLSTVTVGGVASLHFSTHRDRGHLDEILRDVALARFDGTTMSTFAARDGGPVGAMSMFDYDLGRLTSQFVAHGFEQLWLEHTDHGGIHGFWIFGRRSAPRSAPQATHATPDGAAEHPSVATSAGRRLRRWIGGSPADADGT